MRSDVEAYIQDAELVAADGNVTLMARESATILAEDDSFVSAVADSDAGFIVNNLVLSRADAYISGSTVKALDADGSGEQGNMLIEATNTSTIDAFSRGSVSGGGTWASRSPSIPSAGRPGTC
ncbi:MAG: hypothetical protein M5U09_14670 [Gammaproteobacteria bacterium]|nr:hypothetical protein [Gammaproteobacteria bacterium]